MDDKERKDRFDRMKITPEEFKKLSEDYKMKSEDVSEKVKKILIGFGVGLGVSFLLINLVAMLNKDSGLGAGVGTYVWLIFQLFILPLFLYDPKMEQKFVYEQDYAVLLRNLDRKLKLDTIRMRLTIVFGSAFGVVNILAWYFCIFTLIQNNMPQ